MKQNIDNTRINDIDGLKFDVNYMTFVSRSRSSSEKRTSPTSLLLTGATMPRKYTFRAANLAISTEKLGRSCPRERQCIVSGGTQKNLNEGRKALHFSDIKTSADSVICELHWPDDYAEVPARIKPTPKHPPTVWPGLLSCRNPRPMPSCTTSRASLVVRNAQPDDFH